MGWRECGDATIMVHSLRPTGSSPPAPFRSPFYPLIAFWNSQATP